MPPILQRLYGKNQSESVLESPDMSIGKCNSPRLFLASNSPRRRELLALGGWEYNLLSAQVDETPLPDEDGIDYVQRLAKSKVYSAASQVGVDGVIIAADTSVINRPAGGRARIFGKPRDHDEAAEMLRKLRGYTHQVHTAISILKKQDGTLLSDLCTTNVPMRNYDNEEIEAYVASGDPMDKAGAYAIQHAGFHPVEKLEGCFANVMGLPLCHLTRSLIKIGIHTHEDVPQACQAKLGYDCPVYSEILKIK
ncbi:MAG: septum formation protein Maf [Chloroflexi bacterium RBG_19FT_COMBO_50_10]|nr:MAG: septum formation protein Maf [Chloroflexi bacterium RBG_19FT_COMBO_50_10]